ncbi:hypothetical protein HDV04_002098 [Boothiomyces sp. JEL0838]|nr:hypothetical protein HDV04_002098 [Boothiomyces sp. JEL0838]
MDFYFYGLVANGSLLQLANLVSRISILRDWSSCIAKDATNEISLTKLNSRLRLVDLTCDLAAPVIVSLVSSYSTVQIAMVFVMSVSTISIPVEWSMLRMVYNKFPCLAIKVPRVNQSSGFEWSSLGKLWKLPVITTCFSISILYMTVFTINTVSVGYLLSKNTDMLHISLARGISVISGLSSTFSLEKMVKKIGLNSTGLIAIWLQLFCVALALASFYVPLTSEWQAMGVWMFLGGICLSRWGLWTFDLVQQQLLQENIPEDQLGFVSGTEISLQNFFQMIAYVFTIYWSSPVDFWIPSHISAVAVLTAALSFSFYTLRSTSISVDPESSPLIEDVE